MTPAELIATDPATYCHQLLQQGQAAAAREILLPLYQQRPDNLNIVYLLAQAERALQHWPDAVRLARELCQIAPHHAPFHEQLASCLLLQNDGAQVAEALTHYGLALQHAPASPEIAYNLMVMALRADLPQPVLQWIPPLLEQVPVTPQHRLCFAAGVAIAAFVEGDFARCSQYAQQAVALREAGAATEGDAPFFAIYAQFLMDLIAYRTSHPGLYAGDAALSVLHYIGESHCLTPAYLRLDAPTEQGEARSGGRREATGVKPPHKIIPHLQMGGTAFFYTQGSSSWPGMLQATLARIPAQEPVVLGFGELDCRMGAHLMRQLIADKSLAIASLVDGLVTDYMQFIAPLPAARQGGFRLCGVPAPNPMLQAELAAKHHRRFTDLITHFNHRLREESAQRKITFVDIHAHTLGDNGWARDGVHLDKVHLKPEVVLDALRSSCLLST